MKHDGSLDSCLFRGPLYIHKKAPIEQLFKNNHNNESRPKDFNNNKETSNNTGTTQAKIDRPHSKVSSVRCEDP